MRPYRLNLAHPSAFGEPGEQFSKDQLIASELSFPSTAVKRIASLPGAAAPGLSLQAVRITGKVLQPGAIVDPVGRQIVQVVVGRRLSSAPRLRRQRLARWRSARRGKRPAYLSREDVVDRLCAGRVAADQLGTRYEQY